MRAGKGTRVEVQADQRLQDGTAPPVCRVGVLEEVCPQFSTGACTEVKQQSVEQHLR